VILPRMDMEVMSAMEGGAPGRREGAV
jgi:hypothetical protein